MTFQPSLMSQEMSVLLSHETTEWYTPSVYIEAVREVLGSIDLDPASCNEAQKTVKAAKYYTVKDNGLKQPWSGSVFLNPPYSKTGGKSNQELFSSRLIYEYQLGNVTEAILLVKSALGYRWFEQLWDACPTVCFARDLIRFVKSDGTIGGKAKLGSAFFYFGDREARFKEVFSRFGRVICSEIVHAYVAEN